MASDSLAAALAAVRDRPELAALRRGIEKENLRVSNGGALARSMHPAALGSPLTHPHITMDFSEAQLELITGVHSSADAALAELAEVHKFVLANIGDELLWAASMPPTLGAERDIPIARFGVSNAGRSKTVYRNGLSHRYGRRMQTISGIHYNFSVPETLWPAIAAARGEAADKTFVTRAYCGLVRNFRRHAWLLIYLFGASPALCRSFVRDARGLHKLGADSLCLPHATSLRMGRLGYNSDAQAALHISYNSLAQYATTMRAALTTPYPPYEAIGLRAAEANEEDEYRQLSTALLQIENEFYGAIRLKRRTRSGERPLDALHSRGVEYVEVRCLDLDPFLPLGIGLAECRFLDAFLLLCLLDASPPDSPRESKRMLANQVVVVEQGRLPGVRLETAAEAKTLCVWATEILAACQEVAHELDAAAGGDAHVAAVALQRRKVDDPDLTPSANVLAAVREEQSFAAFGLRRSQEQRSWFAEQPMDAARTAKLRRMGEGSLADQAAIEAADREDFDAYLARFLKLGPVAQAPP